MVGTLRMGEMLKRGDGVAQDIQRGAELIQRVASSYDADALVALGDLYASATSGMIDGKAAIAVYSKAKLQH
jgi:TPR repeat protein